jgi:hypothetical protein
MFDPAFFEHVQYGVGEEEADPAEAWRDWTERIWKNVEDSLLRTLLMVWQDHVAMDAKRGAKATRFRRFQWLHADVIVDAG